MITMEVITLVERMIKLYKIIYKEVDEENNKLIFYLCNIGESCICPIYVWNHRITPDAYSRDAAR